VERFSALDASMTYISLPESQRERFKLENMLNHDYLEGKVKLNSANYEQLFRSFEGLNPLHLAIMNNSVDCVKVLIDDTNLDLTEATQKGESPILLACKYGVNIEILESILIGLRSVCSTEQIKEFLGLKDKSGLKAYDYCKAKKRADLGVLIEDFVDNKNKSLIDVSYESIPDYDIKS